MTSLQHITDLDLFQEGLILLDELEDEDLVLDSVSCFRFNENGKPVLAHLWSPPFIVEVYGEDEFKELQQCGRCGGIRLPRFGPYLGPFASCLTLEFLENGRLR